MPLENARTIAELNDQYPLGSDPVGEGDNHLRMIKSVLQEDLAFLWRFNRKYSFQLGATVKTTDVLFNEVDSLFYHWEGPYNGAGNYVVPPGSTPASSGGVGIGAWVAQSDVTIKSITGTPIITDPKFAGGAIGDGAFNNGPVFEAASQMIGDGASIIIPPGRYRIAGDYLLRPVNFIGSGQGSTVIEFDMTLGKFNGLVFAVPALPQLQFGLTNCTVKVVGGRGGNAIVTPVNAFVGLMPKPTFEHLSFCSENAGDPNEGFAQMYSWDWMFLLGDAMCLILRDIDAYGSYKPTVDPNLQNLDGFMRTVPTQGILSMRCNAISSFNIAKFMEIKSKTYFSMHNIDVARCWTGFTDAPDRIYESNRYAYGECNLNFVVINAQKAAFDLKNRFFMSISNSIAHRAGNAFDHGQTWYGYRFDDGQINVLTGMEIGISAGYTGTQVGLAFDGGLANMASNVSFGGPLTSAIRLGGRSLDGGASQGSIINGFTLHSNGVVNVVELAEARGARLSNFTKSSGVTYGTFVTYGNSATQQSCFFSQCPTDNTQEFDDDFFWVRPNGAADCKRWRWNVSDTGFSLATQGDTFAVGNNALIINRTALVIDKVELRTRNTAGGFCILNTPETQFAGFIKPTVTNSFTVGTAPSAWSGGFTQTAFTITSDETVKTPLEDITDAMIDAWAEVNWGQYKLLDRVEAKGADARWHYGIIAQRAMEAFARHGLNAADYGFFCYDEWEAQGDVFDEEGELVQAAHDAGSLYSIRYEEAFALEAALQRRNVQDLKGLIAALTKRLDDAGL